MGEPVIQTSFNAGEWAPKLNARVDLQKYHSGAALLRNFFVDYRGGATTRPGTKFINQARSTTVRLIPFTASFTVTYMLEFGPGYIRFYNNGAPILEAATSITAAASGSPEVFTDTAHGYANNDWLFIGGSYYIVQGATTNTFTLTDLFGNAINTNPFTLPAAAQRVYTILTSPYQAGDLQLIKFAQDVNFLFLCHPNYAPQLLTFNGPTSWTLAPISFAPTIGTPTLSSAATTFAAGSQAVSYIATAVDANGQESGGLYHAYTSLAMSGVAGTNTIIVNAVPGAVSYNLYRSQINFANSSPAAGSSFGFIGNFTTPTLFDSNTNPNFAQGPPILQNPFAGASVQSLTLNAGGAQYSLATTVNITGGGGSLASATATIDPRGVNSVNITNNGQYVNSSGDPAPTCTVSFSGGGGSGATGVGNMFLEFNTGGTSGYGVASVTMTNIGVGYTSPPTPVFTVSGAALRTAATGNSAIGNGAITGLTLTNGGESFTSAPSVSFSNVGSGTGASATATIGAPSSGNPSVPALVQQRSFFGGPQFSPSQFNLSQPGSPFNFNISFPLEDDDAIQATLTSNTLNSIKSAVAVSAGLIIFSDKAAWLVNGGSSGSAIGATTIVANAQGYSGASDLPPIVTPNDILYNQAKGSIVRDLSYNFYTNTYQGMDVSILSSHLFYGFSLLQWAWAEEPFKVVWAVRSDGTLLSFTYMKDQELLAWAHSDTQGSFTSVATVNEPTAIGNVDAVYVAVNRTVNGQSVTYIERFVELNYPNDYISSWQVDAGIGYIGAPATTFSGAQQLGGMAVTGLADGVVINFTMPTSGTFVFGPGGTTGLTGIASASVVTVGLQFLPQLQTLALDLGGEPTVQSKRKRVTAVTTRVAQALGLSAGRTLDSVQPMKDLVLGNIGTMSNTRVNGLQTTDARIIVDPIWDVFGQYYVVQPNPYPASILGVIPEVVVGDSK